MERPYVLLLETLSAGATEELNRRAIVLNAPSPDAGVATVDGHPVRAILTRGKGVVDRALIDACPQLEVIARAGVGLDNVDVDYATQKGVKVINAPGANAATVAEHTLGLLLALRRNLFEAILQNKGGNWAYRHEYTGDELRGQTIGILGRGNIGTRVARLAEAFGMNVLYLARTRVQYEELKSDERNLHELMAEADVLSLHLPLTNRTRHLLNTKVLSHCRPGAVIINTARGELVDHDALDAALEAGKLGGYAADVMSQEQRAAHASLIERTNVLITPHIASLTERTFTDMCETTVRNVGALLEGKGIPERYVANRG